MEKKIGQLIKERVKSQNVNVTEFAKNIGMERTNVYDIYERESIDTGLLKKIGHELHYDFFQDLLEPETVREIVLRHSMTNRVYVELSLTEEEDNLITIPSEVAKNHCERQISMPMEIAVLMADHIKSTTSDQYLFSFDYKPGKKLLTTRDTGRTWSNLRKALGLPACYQFYSLKDTGITEMLEAGVPAKMVQELADHHSLEMTQKYVGKSKAEDIRRKCAVIHF